jgi:hypothetical protein
MTVNIVSVMTRAKSQSIVCIVAPIVPAWRLGISTGIMANCAYMRTLIRTACMGLKEKGREECCVSIKESSRVSDTQCGSE